MASSDVVAVLEAAYLLDLDEPGWLRAIASAASPILDAGVGVSAWTMRAGEGGVPQLAEFASVQQSPELVTFARALIGRTPPRVAESFFQVPVGCAKASELIPEDLRDSFTFPENPFGVVDLLGVQGVDLDGSAVVVGVPLLDAAALHPQFRARWNRVAAHVTAGLRLRSRLAGSSVAAQLAGGNAILDPDGRIVEARGAATSAGAADVLRASAVAVDRARSRGTTADDALELWRALCDGTWSLVETFDTDGRRFMVAHENEPPVRGYRALSKREEQIVGFAAMGHAENLIGYEFGLSESTVRGHLDTAMAKLGVNTRLDLIRLVHALGAQSQAG